MHVFGKGIRGSEEASSWLNSSAAKFQTPYQKIISNHLLRSRSMNNNCNRFRVSTLIAVLALIAVIYIMASGPRPSKRDSGNYHPLPNNAPDLITTSLPGAPSKPEPKQYLGYITVDEVKGRQLFYYFVGTSAPEADSKPLILWLNGDPGCSSVGMDAFIEIGPYGVQKDGRTLYTRPHSWNTGLEWKRPLTFVQ